MSASFQVWHGDLRTAASSASLLPIRMQTPVASIEAGEAGLHGFRECLFSLQRQVRLFFPGSGQLEKSDNFD
jgi:hypothetical protein